MLLYTAEESKLELCFEGRREVMTAHLNHIWQHKCEILKRLKKGGARFLRAEDGGGGEIKMSRWQWLYDKI